MDGVKGSLDSQLLGLLRRHPYRGRRRGGRLADSFWLRESGRRRLGGRDSTRMENIGGVKVETACTRSVCGLMDLNGNITFELRFALATNEARFGIPSPASRLLQLASTVDAKSRRTRPFVAPISVQSLCPSTLLLLNPTALSILYKTEPFTLQGYPRTAVNPPPVWARR